MISEKVQLVVVNAKLSFSSLVFCEIRTRFDYLKKFKKLPKIYVFLIYT